VTNDPFAAGSGDLGHDDGLAPLPGDGGRPAADDRSLDGAVEAIQRPAKYSEALWRRAITVYQLYWDREGIVPTPEQAHRSWNRIPAATYSELSLEPEFQRALELRGIELDPTESLSDIQVMVLMKLTDPADRRTERAKLRDLGVSWPRYQGWLRNPVFVKEKRRRTEETFADVTDVALIKLRGNVEAGDQRAIEFALEVTGRHNRQQLAVQDARLVVQTIVEAVIKNVPDAATRDAILNDARAAVTGFDLNNRKALG
jgi:hypothetical protein